MEPKKTFTLFYGGVVTIGRNMNFLSSEAKPFIGITEMAAADLRLVDLECVIATTGEMKLSESKYYFRARPEQTNILVRAGIDIVLTANDHAMDYGAEALFEQRNYLDAAGILYAGSGKNISEAFKPVYKKIDDITIAIFSVDTTKKSTAVSEDEPGVAYLPLDKPELWKENFAERIREAHEKAHVVIVAPHWGGNLVGKPSEEIKNIGHLLIDLGADAVLGCHSHALQGVENYKERPIIYDAGDFLFDWGRRTSGCFTLEISSDGVEKVKLIPIVVRYCRTDRAINSAPPIKKNFIEACNELKTATKDSGGGAIEISFNPPSRESKIVDDFSLSIKKMKYLIEPLAEPKSEWIVDKVPDEAIIPPKNFDGLKLVGYYISPECRTMTERKFLNVETYWTIEESLNKNFSLSITGVPVRECGMPAFSTNMDHAPIDQMYPVNRWKPGIIYHEKFPLRPPVTNQMANVDLRVQVNVKLDGKVIGGFKDSETIKMRVPNLRFPYWRTEFDDIIYQSEPGKCWTAEQLAKVTGGEWIVPPPEGWYVQSLIRMNITNMNCPPSLFLAPGSNSRAYLIKNVDKFVGAMVTRSVKGLPSNFPLLKVKDVGIAFRELGFAARKRFQGKVIAVTGSAGKTTTCNMLNCVLGKEHNIMATWGSSNMYDVVPRVFAHVKQDDAYAIIEMSIDALHQLPGSICYEIMPHIAVVTSISPAHIGNGTLERLATHKSKIFNGMSLGSYAILNRDMPCYEIFEQKAKSLKLNIITFGTHPEAFVRMPVLEDGGEFFVGEKTYRLSCPVPTEQFYDALAVVGVSIVSGFSIEKALEYLKTFEIVKGRGNTIKVNRNGKNLTIINSAFNANPVSIKYALQHLKNIEPNQKSRVAILGDIAELGNHSVELHKGLAEAMLAAEPDRLLLCGEFMRYPYEIVKDKLNVIYFDSLDKLLNEVETYLQDGDTVLVKSSHDTGLHKVVDMLSKITPPN